MPFIAYVFDFCHVYILDEDLNKFYKLDLGDKPLYCE